MRLIFKMMLFLMVVSVASPAFALRSISTPGAKKVMNESIKLLEAQRYDQLEAQLNRYLVKEEKIEDGQWKFHIAMDGITGGGALDAKDGKTVERLARQVEKWAAKRKNSELAKTALVKTWTTRAWLYRGGKYAADTPEESHAAFKRALREGLLVAQTMKVSDKANPEFYMNLLTLGLGMGFPSETMDQIYAAGIKAHPEYFYLTLQALTPKFQRWSGDREAIYTAMDRLVDTPEFFARAMWHLFLYEEHDQLKALGGVEAGKVGFKLIRNKYHSPITENQAAFFACGLWGDKDLFREAAVKIGKNPDPSVWSAGVYDQCHAWAASRE